MSSIALIVIVSLPGLSSGPSSSLLLLCDCHLFLSFSIRIWMHSRRSCGRLLQLNAKCLSSFFLNSLSQNGQVFPQVLNLSYECSLDRQPVHPFNPNSFICSLVVSSFDGPYDFLFLLLLFSSIADILGDRSLELLLPF